MPLWLVSDQTKSPTLTAGLMKPKSSEVSLAPSVVRSVETAVPLEESSCVLLPAPVRVGTNPTPVSTVWELSRCTV